MPRVLPVRVTALAVALLLPLGLVACSDDDDSANVVSEEETTDDDSSTTTTEGEESTTTTAGEDDGTDDDGSDDGSDEDDGDDDGSGGGATSDLASILLVAGDLPDGFTQDDEDTTDGGLDEDDPLCEGGEAPPHDPVDQISRDFQSEADFALVGSYVARFDGGAAEATMDYFRQETQRCAATPDEGTAYEVIEVDGIGDDALNVRLTDPEDPASGSYDAYFARVGDLIIGVYALVDPTSGIDAEALLATSAGRA